MMHDIGPLAAVQRGDRRHGAAGADDAVAAPPPAQRLEPKPLGADPVAVRALARRDDDFEPGIPRRPRDRQPVRPEIPILGDQKISFGRWRAACGGLSTGDLPLKDLSSGALETASTPGSRTICRQPPEIAGRGVADGKKAV